MTPMSVLSMLSVYLYGLCLTAAFLNIPFSKKGLALAALQTALCIALQSLILSRFGSRAVEMAYPFICHLPILLISVFVYKRSLSSAAAALLAAYLLTIPRNLVGDVAMLVWSGQSAKDIAKVLATLPLLILFCKLLTPAMRRLPLFSRQEQLLFLAPALAYYVSIYATSVYTQLAYSGSDALLHFLVMLMCMFTFVYVFLNYRRLAELSELRQREHVMKLQSSEMAVRLEEIRLSQRRVREMRHDMRHFLQILHDCAASGDLNAVQSYISNISDEIESTVVQQYCENESVNLILSSYSGRAKRLNVELRAVVSLPEALEHELDVCVLLANSLENALCACAGQTTPNISVECSRHLNKTVIQIKNPCKNTIVFVDGFPQSDRKGHGFGVRSIAALAERNGGAANFSVENGVFILRAVL